MTRVALVAALLMVGCRKPPPPIASDAGVVTDAMVGAPSPPRRHVFRYAGWLCIGTDGAGVECGGPSGRALRMNPRPQMSGMVAAATGARCWLRDDGTAFCDDREVARNVKSVAAAPYLLSRDGSVVVAPGKHDDDKPADEDKPPPPTETSFRIAAVKKLPAVVDQLARTDFYTCALANGEVRCWTEPRYGFNTDVEGMVTPQPALVAGLRDVEEIAVMPWLTLCARTRAGAVLCSPSLPTTSNVCELRGQHDVRCGDHRLAEPGPKPLVEPSYDPRQIVSRPLVPIPGLDGKDPARSRALFNRGRGGMGESSRRVYQGDFDEGGCAELASGAVRCFERDLCAPTKPWRSAEVSGLARPPGRLVLTAADGYAVSAAGALSRWARRPLREPHEDCTTPSPPFEIKAEPVPLTAPVLDIDGHTTWHFQTPGSEDIACATLLSGDVTCWRASRSDAPTAVAIEATDAGSVRD